jgi:cell filamentation protein
MKYYPPSNHIYYDDSDIPINKLDIKDSTLIHELEKEQLIKSYEIMHNELSENTIFDKEYLKKVNHRIFGFLYKWAGDYRTVNISKGTSMFCPYNNLAAFSNDIFKKLEKDNYLKGYEDINKRDEFIEKLSFYMCELIVLHPFNEGNGRTIRFFFDMICTYNGYEYINYKDTLKDEKYILASIDCMSADCERMKEILDRGLVYNSADQ